MNRMRKTVSKMAEKDKERTENTLYFAFGSNLSQEQMAQRCPNSTYVGVGFLQGYRWHINTRGYANIIWLKDSAETENTGTNLPGVYGLLYSLTEEDEAILDRCEGVPWAYSKVADVAQVWPGAEAGCADVNGHGYFRDVLLYIDELRKDDSQPNDEYIGRMNRGIANGIARGIPADKILPMIRKFIPE